MNNSIHQPINPFIQNNFDPPIHLFDSLLLNAVNEMQSNIQAPVGMICSAVLAAITAACQNNTCVKTPLSAVKPVCAFYSVEASSGSRKTETMNAVTKSFYIHDAELKAQRESKIKHYDYEHVIWRERKKVFERGFRSHVRDGTPLEDSAKQAYEELLKSEPTKPLFRTSIIGDATPAALQQAYRGHNALALFSSEGNSFFEGPLMANPALLNDSHDGTPLHIERATGPSFTVLKPRLTTLTMIQSKTLARHLKKRGDLARDIGYWARQKFCSADAKFGLRPTTSQEQRWDATDLFNQRILQILRNEVGTKDSDSSIVLEFSDDAKDIWFQYAAHIENLLAPNKLYSHIRDNASKAPEYAARLAAVLHRFYGCDGRISRKTLLQAIGVSDWYLEQFLQKFGQLEAVPEFIDASILEKWLDNYSIGNPGVSRIVKSHIRRFGPNSLRSNWKLDRALAVLASAGKIGGAFEGKMEVVILYATRFPNVLPPHPFGNGRF